VLSFDSDTPGTPTVLPDLIDRAARCRPDQVAVSTTTERLTHAELAAASRRGAAWLQALGVRRGQRVVVVGPSSVLLAALVYSVARIGAVFCLLHEQTRGRPLEHVLSDAEPVLLLAADPEALALARDRGVSAVDLDTAATHVLAGAVPAEVPVVPLAVDPVCLIYTSGTTSAPKAVVSTHAQVVFSATAIQSVLKYRADDVVYCPLPLSFDYGMYQLFLGASSGAHVRLGRAADAGPPLLRNLLDAQATVLAAVPSVAENLVRLLARRPERVPPLRLLTNTGAAMPPETLAELRSRIPSLHVQLMFGLTECKRATIMPPDGDLERPGSSGRALPGTEVFAISPAGERLPPGEIGEVVVRGPNVMAGYWRHPELTAERFPKAEGLFPQLRTGDYGWLDEDGYLYFVGRLDDLYKERGFRVSATEVEAAARRVPGVQRAAVLPPLDGEPAVVAVVGDVTPQDVLAGMRDEIEAFKIPRRCVVVADLPLTRNGKVDRKLLRAEVAHG
jgi:acyl-CoA synthetase (AMP-forming)/AMP-acid ligase II